LESKGGAGRLIDETYLTPEKAWRGSEIRGKFGHFGDLQIPFNDLKEQGKGGGYFSSNNLLGIAVAG
jgi:hypothetical protein